MTTPGGTDLTDSKSESELQSIATVRKVNSYINSIKIIGFAFYSAKFGNTEPAKQLINNAGASVVPCNLHSYFKIKRPINGIVLRIR
ncbi:hypothetical protein [uncultured Psychroserpens sp.]|uniref:hypothetical protein n=1 Tax=uncultured Psychroserpens sp. TaxID=255436 RepID=UPI0026207B59|nr:hypothetical protein [uncultured Psychroserpens sp.]